MITITRAADAWEFATAHAAALFMWGRDFRWYTVYKDGRRLPWDSGDLAAFERALEGF